MYLKKLELNGFKSFADRTILHFEPGITAVVGPNGCGKSNIFDSIRWVLGEQSVKSLRGSKMEDVIFNGTDTKPAVGFAEVSLTFSNENKMLPIEYDEVTISRRLFRSGESEYLINKNIVRLKDINELFMGTGIGAESYSLVEQGKIDLVLSSHPEDRRLVFDEAAGITKYKSQKRETLRKLEDADQNLLRLNDIIVEVKRQINSLERQAAKARRYKEVFENLKNLEIKLNSFHIKNLLGTQEKIKNNIEELEKELTQSIQALADLKQKLSQRETDLTSYELEVSSLNNQLFSLLNAVEKYNHQINLNNERVNELGARGNNLVEQKKQIQERMSQDLEKIETLKKDTQELINSKGQKEDTLNLKEEEQGNINKEISQCHRTIEKAKLDIFEFSASETQVRNQINDTNSQMQSVLARKKRLDIEKMKVTQEREEINANLNLILPLIEESCKKIEDLKLKLSLSLQDQDTNKKEIASLKEKIQNLQNEKLSLESQKEFLEKLKLTYQDNPESLEAVILLNELPKNQTSGIVAKIKEISNLSNEEKIRLGCSYRITCEAKPIPLDTKDIDNRIKQIINEVNSDKELLVLREKTLQELEPQIENLEKEVHQEDIVLENKNTQRRQIEESLSRVEQEINLVILELDQTESDLKNFEQKGNELKEKELSVENDLLQARNSIVSSQEIIAGKTTLREENLVLITQLTTQLQSLEDKIESSASTLKLLEDAFNQDKDNLEQAEKETINCLKKIGDINQENQNLKIKIEESLKEKGLVDNKISESKQRNIDLIKEINTLRENLNLNQENQERLQNEIHTLKMQTQEISYKETSIKERVMQVYKISLETMSFNSDELIDIDSLSNQIEELKRKLDSYGIVNLVAIEEYDELKQRYDFLIQQQNDLVTAKEALKETISKINRTTRKMFLETFEKIAVEFKNYFRLLFNGGDAQLILIDQENPLESGIEIICRPPGKKLQNVLLLSGGEKAMSAVALIFAIFKIKPSPFCVLDEIDAPLDETNVMRFGGLLHEFTKTSQFVIITHNKKTIANANLMYGITMQESGVSKIVSVKFANDEPGDSVESEEVGVSL